MSSILTMTSASGDVKYRVQVRLTGHRAETKTFEKKGDAVAWGKAIEKRLKALPRGSTKPPAEYAMSLPRTRIDEVIGVYFLFYEGACVYVGQSASVHARIANHRQRLPCDEYAFIRVPADKLTEVEAMYIAALRPRFNVRGNPESLGQEKRDIVLNRTNAAASVAYLSDFPC